MFTVNIDEFQRIVIRGRKTVISYRMCVKKGAEDWFIFHTEEQILNLAKTLHKPIIEGFLLKKSVHGVPNWNKRYFRLLGNVLAYSHDCTNTTPQNTKTIDLLHTTISQTYDFHALVVGLFSKNLLDGKGVFEIRLANKRVIYLKAPSHAEMVKWIAELTSASRPVLRRRVTAPILLVKSMQSRPDESSYSDQELVRKRTDLNTFLKKLCECYHDSEILHSFLMAGKHGLVKYPQMRLMVDIMQTDLSLIKKLHEDYGVPLNFTSEGIPFIAKACRKGSLDLVKYILASETEASVAELVNKPDKDKHTPLYHACESGSFEIAHLLIANNAISNIPEFGLWTPLHHLAQKPSPMVEEHVTYLGEIVQHLVDCIDIKDARGQTALHLCAKENNTSMALFLLSNGADYTLTDCNGMSFLHLLAGGEPKKTLKMMQRILDYMFKSVVSLSEYDRHMILLDLRDNEGKTAIQYVHENPSYVHHVTLLQHHYLKLEDLKFSVLFSELMWKYNTESMRKDVGDVFASLIEFLCIACSVNDYHSDILQLITRSIDFRNQAYQELRKSKMKDFERAFYEKRLLEGIYPIVYTLFLKKKILLDTITNKYLLMYREHATFRSFGIEEEVWKKIQLSGRDPDSVVSETDPEPPLVKKALKIITSIPTKVAPSDKAQCLEEIFDLFECNAEVDNKISLLTYLMVRAADPHKGVQWSAEIDYITTFSRIECNLLLSIRMFFLTSWMQKKSGIFYVDIVGSLETSTILDIKCLWQDLKKSKTAFTDMDLLHSLFFNCAHIKFAETKTITLAKQFSEQTMNSHFMKEIIQRLQLKITPTNDNKGCTVKYGDFVDASVFSRIAGSFVDLSMDLPP
jgi:ankyrin repeat protein